MNSKPRVRSDLLHFMRNVNPFSKKSFEVVIAQNLSDVKSFLKYFSESPEAQTEENVKAFFKIFFFGAELRNKVANLTAELDTSEYRTFIFPRIVMKKRNTVKLSQQNLTVVSVFLNSTAQI